MKYAIHVGGTQIWFGQGVLLEPQNLYLFLRVILQKKAPIFRDFSLNRDPFLHVFGGKK